MGRHSIYKHVTPTGRNPLPTPNRHVLTSSLLLFQLASVSVEHDATKPPPMLRGLVCLPAFASNYLPTKFKLVIARTAVRVSNLNHGCVVVFARRLLNDTHIAATTDLVKLDGDTPIR